MPVASFSTTTQLALGQAQEAIITLKTVKPLLSPLFCLLNLLTKFISLTSFQS